MANQIGFSNAMKEVIGNNFVTLDQLKNDNEIYFPLFKNNANGTEAKKILGKLIANNSGGSSSDYVMPNNVIVINPDADVVSGKVYNHFADAMEFMEANPSLKFCVELPAGDFGTTADDHITLSEQWEIHGNKTKIVAPIDTKIVETGNMQGIYNTSRSIQNCTISEGFVVDTGATGIKCYHVYDCVILKMSTDTGAAPTTAAIFAHNSTIKTGDESGTSTQWFVGLFVSCIVENLNIVGGGIIGNGFRFIGCYIESSYTCNANVSYCGCYISESHGGAQLASDGIVRVVGCDISGASISADVLYVYSSMLSPISDISILSQFHVCNSYVCTALTGNITIPAMFIEHSELIKEYGGTLTVTALTCDAVSFIDDNIVIPNRNANIVYSTDGGTTISNDPTGATHYGICKDLTKTTVDVSNYMWFPMPSNS